MFDQFDLFLPQYLVFGWGRRGELSRLASNIGKICWIVCGSRTLVENGTIKQIQDSLSHGQCKSEILCIQSREPTVEDVDQAVLKLRNSIDSTDSQNKHWVLGIGGGAGIDLAKAVAIVATNRHGRSVNEFLEGIGDKVLVYKSIPVLAMPTTAGTGSEATKNSVITSPLHRAKRSLRSPMMVPKAVLIDPELATSAPTKVIAHSGMDAITQLIESFTSRFANQFTRSIAMSGMQNVTTHLLGAYQDGANREAFATMSYAAYCSGVALANSGLGMAHGVAAALGAICDIPHGLACAMMLPATLRTNYQSCKRDYAILHEVCTCEGGSATKFIESIEKLSDDLGIPRSLSKLGVRDDQIPELVKASRGNSMNGNPIALDDKQLTRIIESLL